MQPLRGLAVVEVAGSVAGAYCAKLFADQGAEVVLVGESGLPEFQTRYLHAAKARSTIDEIDPSVADVVIESSAPEPLSPLGPDAIGTVDTVRVRISPFGTHGPRSTWRGTDLTDYAAGGHAYLYGDPAREPLRGPPDQPAVASGLFGFIGAMAALVARDRLGHGQTVDVGHVQVMAALHQFTLLRWLMTGDVLRRMGNRYTGQGQPNGPYPCADGWVSIAAVTDQQVDDLLAVTGLDHLLDDERILSPLDFQHHPDLLDGPLIAWLADRTVDEVVDLFQTLRVPTSPVLGMDELLTDPQLMARRFFGPAPDDPVLKIPGPPFSIDPSGTGDGDPWRPGPIEHGPLAGLAVLDLTRIWAGPLAGRILADLGADVVWVEAPWSRGPRTVPPSMVAATRYFVDDDPGDRPWNRNGHFVKYALGKRSLAIDLQSEPGRAAFARVVPHFDVLVENFSTRVMPQLGLGGDRLHELHPDLIYATMPGFGRSGPAEHWLAYGSTVDSHAGLSSLIGYRDQVPWKGGIAWPDPVAGLHTVAAILSAVWVRARPGTGGMTIECAQLESSVAAIGDRVIEAQLDGPYAPDGNRRPGSPPEGIYRCRGDDEWIAISATDARSIDAIGEVLGARLAHDADGFDRVVATSTPAWHADELAARLQGSGVAAAAVASAPDVLADPHLLARAAFATVDQPDVGPFTAPETPVALDATPARVRGPAPTLGQHNDDILAAAGLTADEIGALSAAGTVADAPPI